MAAAQSPVRYFGRKAVEFDLPDSAGKRHGLALIRDLTQQTHPFTCSIRWKRS